MTALPTHSRFSLPSALRTGVALALSLALASCGGGGGSTGTDGGTNASGTWTYMVYISGDNDLSSMAGLDIDEMAAANSNGQVRVPVLMEQSRTYTAGASSTTLRGIVTKGNKQLTSVGSNLDMSKKQTLTDFINWSKQNYPADHYGLVLWSHGGGWKGDKTARGALIDATSGGSGTVMSVKDMASAIQAAGGVDLLNFDACLMGMYEVAYEMKDAAKVMVASEESIPGQGNPYTAVLNHLTASPGQDAATLAKTIVSDYDTYYRGYRRNSVQLSAIDLTKIGTVHQKAQETASLLKTELGTARQAISAARDGAPHYDYPSNRDLAVFADALAANPVLSSGLRSKSGELAAAARAAVLSNKNYVGSTGNTDIGRSTGLAVYLPQARETSASERSKYTTALASNSNAAAVSSGATWSSFVDQLVTGDTGGGTSLEQTTGGFSYYVTWDNPQVDLDLQVNEPSGEWAGPYHGSTSTNGFSSSDSWNSELSFESYTANDALDKGKYDVFVTYAGCQPAYSSCGATTVSVYRYNPSAPNNDTDYVKLGERVMSQGTPLPDNLYPTSDPASWATFVNAVNTDNYSDWLYVSQVTRALVGTEKSFVSSIKTSRKTPSQVSK